MAETPRTPAAPQAPGVEEAPTSIRLVAYPKAVFLYPLFLISLAAAVYLSFGHHPLDGTARGPVLVTELFLVAFLVNSVILAFDFPRTTSLTLFFLLVALLLGFALLCTFHPRILPALHSLLIQHRPVANATFYWSFAAILGGIFLAVLASVPFDYWEVRPNELLHHHGILSNLERIAAPNLRIDKEINDIFEYMLLGSGRLIIHGGDERRPIILDNVPFITRKEEAITRMLGALQVQVRPEEPGPQ